MNEEYQAKYKNAKVGKSEGENVSQFGSSESNFALKMVRETAVSCCKVELGTAKTA